MDRNDIVKYLLLMKDTAESIDLLKFNIEGAYKNGKLNEKRFFFEEWIETIRKDIDYLYNNSYEVELYFKAKPSQDFIRYIQEVRVSSFVLFPMYLQKLIPEYSYKYVLPCEKLANLDKWFPESIMNNDDYLLKEIFGEYLEEFIELAKQQKKGTEVANIVNSFVKDGKIKKSKLLFEPLRNSLFNKRIINIKSSTWNGAIK